MSGSDKSKLITVNLKYDLELNSAEGVVLQYLKENQTSNLKTDILITLKMCYLAQAYEYRGGISSEELRVIALRCCDALEKHLFNIRHQFNLPVAESLNPSYMVELVNHNGLTQLVELASLFLYSERSTYSAPRNATNHLSPHSLHPDKASNGNFHTASFTQRSNSNSAEDSSDSEPFESDESMKTTSEKTVRSRSWTDDVDELLS